MNYTEKYHLPQWVETDRVMMRDFNQMCRDIDAGLDRNAQAARARRRMRPVPPGPPSHRPR